MKSIYWRGLIAASFASLSLLSAVAAPNDAFQIYRDPGGRFSIEFPKDWGWLIVAGSGEALVTMVQPKKEAAVVVEHVRMKQILNPEDITEVFAQIESDVLKENQPRATDVMTQVLTKNGQPQVILEYTRPGIGEDEHVRQYSFPTGQDLYRVTCMALASQFKKYDATFASVVETLKPAAALEKPAAVQPERRR